MNRHQLRSVWKRALHLDLGNHLGHAVHHRVGWKDRGPKAHDLGDGPSLPNQLEYFGGDEGDGLGMIELQPAGATLPRDFSGSKDQQLVDFTGREVHSGSKSYLEPPSEETHEA
jgi:hypothetical protein